MTLKAIIFSKKYHNLHDLFASQLSLYFISLLDRVHSSSLSNSSSMPAASLRSVLMFSSKSLKSMLVSSPPAASETTSLPTSESVSNRLFSKAPEPLLILIFFISPLDSLKQPLPLPVFQSCCTRMPCSNPVLKASAKCFLITGFLSQGKSGKGKSLAILDMMAACERPLTCVQVSPFSWPSAIVEYTTAFKYLFLF